MKIKRGIYLYIGPPSVFGSEMFYCNDTSKLTSDKMFRLNNNQAVLFTSKDGYIVRVQPEEVNQLVKKSPKKKH